MNAVVACPRGPRQEAAEQVSQTKGGLCGCSEDKVKSVLNGATKGGPRLGLEGHESHNVCPRVSTATDDLNGYYVHKMK